MAGKIAFRGGTAIHKQLFKQPLRYSEDVDLVQAHPELIGGTVDAIRAALSWLGKCSREQAGHSMHLGVPNMPKLLEEIRERPFRTVARRRLECGRQATR